MSDLPRITLARGLPDLVKTPVRRLDRMRIARKRHLRWWLVYGPVRSGTTYMMSVIGANARLQIGDWGLRHGLGLPPDLPHVRFDRRRARADFSRNVISNAPSGGGGTLDLVYKSAQLRRDEFDALIEMWGAPQRVIFCVREPSGYLASACRKFPDVDVQAFRDEYLRDLATFEEIGGDVFAYGPHLTTDAYREFLAPMTIPEGADHEFTFRGSAADDLVTPDMVQAFERIDSAMNLGSA